MNKSKCEVVIEKPVKNELVFEFDADGRDVRFSICDSGGYIKLSGLLKKQNPHRIDVSALESGKYILKLVDGDVWGDNRFEIS